MTRYLLLISLVGITSCAGLTGRTYLSEMEHDDSNFYGPGEDFPVVGGDSRIKGYSEEEYRRNRLPLSREERAMDREGQLLAEELRSLESSQTDDEIEFYQKHKKKFSNNSERIYFLKLPRGERRQYLQDRGFIDSPSRSIASDSSYGSRSSLNLGMTKNDVMASLGRPARVEIAGNPSFENERWLYQFSGSSKYIYFESGVVQGWE